MESFVVCVIYRQKFERCQGENSIGQFCRVVIPIKLDVLKAELSLPSFSLNVVWPSEKISYNRNYIFMIIIGM
jgi:hypothetical protein